MMIFLDFDRFIASIMPLNKLKACIRVPKYVQASILTSLGGALFGLDTGTIGPITTMPQFAQTFGHLSSTLHGLVVSTILIPAAVSSFFGGHLANSVGRPRAIAIGAGIFGFGAAIECASVRLAMLIVGRAVKGIGEGFFLSTVVVYITEISPPRSRGTLASIPQLFTTIGICTGYFTCYGSVNILSSLSWRLPFALQAAIAFTFTISTLMFLPQSPRWMTARRMHKEALALWEELGVEAAEREKLEETDNGQISEGVKMKDLLAVFGKHAWKRTALGAFLMGMQQLSGIDGVLYVCSSWLLDSNKKLTMASMLLSSSNLRVSRVQRRPS